MNTNFLSIFKNIKISSIAGSLNKTLNVVRKSIPVYKEIRPYVNHEKSIFKKTEDENVNEIKESKPLKSNNNNNNDYNDSLTFFQ